MSQLLCENCNTPLLSDEEREAGICNECYHDSVDAPHTDFAFHDITPIDTQFDRVRRPANFGDFQPEPTGHEDDEDTDDLGLTPEELASLDRLAAEAEK